MWELTLASWVKHSSKTLPISATVLFVSCRAFASSENPTPRLFNSCSGTPSFAMRIAGSKISAIESLPEPNCSTVLSHPAAAHGTVTEFKFEAGIYRVRCDQYWIVSNTIGTHCITIDTLRAEVLQVQGLWRSPGTIDTPNLLRLCIPKEAEDVC